MSPSACPPNNFSGNFNVPRNMTYFIIPGNNTSDPAMAKCCTPDTVIVIDTCFTGCQPPANWVASGNMAKIWSRMSQCYTDNGGKVNTNYFHEGKESSGVKSGAGLGQLLLLALGVSALVLY